MIGDLTTIQRDFNGEPVTLIERDDGSVWMTGDQVAVCLGYGDKRAVLKLAARHADEIAGHRDVVKMTTTGGAKDVAIFDEHALYVLGFHGETDRAKAWRAWLATTLRDLRTKDKIVLDREEWEQTRSLNFDLLAAYETQASANKLISSLAGRILGMRSRTKPKTDPRQLLFPAMRFEEIEETPAADGGHASTDDEDGAAEAVTA